jgi:hypothetical protein
MTTKRSRVLTGVRVNNETRLYWRLASAGAWSSMTFVGGSDATPRIYYPSGGGEAFDLIAQINARLTAAGAPFSVGLVVDPSHAQWGKLSITTSANYLALSSRGSGAHGAAAYSDMLWRMLFPGQFRDQTFSWVTEGTGTRTAHAPEVLGGCLHLRRLVLSLRVSQMLQGAQGVADDGTTSTVLIGMQRRYVMKVGLIGALPRSLLWNEHAQVLSFLDACGRGSAALIYPHSDAAAPYSRHADAWEPSGYVWGMLRRESLEWLPSNPDWYQQWDKELLFDRLATAPLA